MKMPISITQGCEDKRVRLEWEDEIVNNARPMTIVQRKLRVPYSASQMFQLVDRIEDYKLFVPWCKDSQVLSRTDDEVRATLILSGGGIHKSFTTCNRVQRDKMIEISLISGPFRRLEGFWLFHHENEKSCTVQFDIEFEFASKLLSLAFSKVFNQIAATLIDAFVKRAAQVYGQASISH